VHSLPDYEDSERRGEQVDVPGPLYRTDRRFRTSFAYGERLGGRSPKTSIASASFNYPKHEDRPTQDPTQEESTPHEFRPQRMFTSETVA
jgi:hypothetical protein